ncbi:hypothetical protein AVEN_243195-1 [Araneus ventricosus]|uniref:Uncharacterized protein n=1 Tax=Araneus ventricosus TaxID=182803 RepID=A0A4Y2F034_ARAVE|nr:hypothetical protein AVEN_243195-1 [Araneus ventricosus]
MMICKDEVIDEHKMGCFIRTRSYEAPHPRCTESLNLTVLSGSSITKLRGKDSLIDLTRKEEIQRKNMWRATSSRCGPSLPIHLPEKLSSRNGGIT